MRVNVYVDGFNLYYRRLRGGPYKWLNPKLLAEAVTAADSLGWTRYFTARIKADPLNPQQPQRQQDYLRALETVPMLTIHFGTFKIRKKQRRLASNPKQLVWILQPEEKGQT